MSERKGPESAFSYQLRADAALDRYQRIRMAVFSPEYLIVHSEFTETDFTALIDGIVALHERVESDKRAILELIKINGELHRAREALAAAEGNLMIEAEDIASLKYALASSRRVVLALVNKELVAPRGVTDHSSYELGVTMERERCAKIAEEWIVSASTKPTGKSIAAAIRSGK